MVIAFDVRARGSAVFEVHVARVNRIETRLDEDVGQREKESL